MYGETVTLSVVLPSVAKFGNLCVTKWRGGLGRGYRGRNIGGYGAKETEVKVQKLARDTITSS